MTTGSGFVKQRGSKWNVVIREPGGQRRWYSGFPTKKAARARLTELLGDMQSNAYVEPSRKSLSAFLNEWLAARASQVRPSTLHGYAKNIRAHITPGVGALPLQGITPQRLNAFYAGLLTAGRRDGKGALAPRTVKHIHTVLRRALADAVRWRMLPSNPADLADPPKAGAKEMHIWQPAELRAFLASVQDDRLAALWTLAATTGARRGEVLGLRWQDVDLAAGRMTIAHTLLDVGHKLTWGEPKTARGVRSLSLDAHTLDALRSHKVRQSAEIMAFGRADWPAHGLVFTTEIGAPIHPAWLSRAFTQRARTAGLPVIRFHDLRHTAASLSLAAGIPAKVVSERLGHATVAFTLDTYTKVLPQLDQDAADRLGVIVFGG